MKILVVGSGGREHAILWKLKQSPRITKLYCAPGNGGISEIAECVPIDVSDIKGMVSFARENRIDLVVVGPDDPLAAGMVDALKNAGMTDVYVIGVDGCSVGYDQVKEGTQALCIGQSFSQMTRDAFDCITKIMNGKECEEVVWTALDIVTKDTIDNFPYPEW